MSLFSRAALTCLLVGAGSIAGPAQSQHEMNRDAERSLERADAELNRVYKLVVNKHAGEKGFVTDLKEAQRAWLRYLEFHLKTVFPLKEGENAREVYGSIHPLEFAVAKRDLIVGRTKELAALLE